MIRNTVAHVKHRPPYKPNAFANQNTIVSVAKSKHVTIIENKVTKTQWRIPNMEFLLPGKVDDYANKKFNFYTYIYIYVYLYEIKSIFTCTI